MDVFKLAQGSSPILVSIPHCGTHIPDDLLANMTHEATHLVDTDWHVDYLYDFLNDLDVTVLSATHSRYVVDLNRPRDGLPLYPGQSESTLCPTSTFAGEPLYAATKEPSRSQIERRVTRYWQPYHDALGEEIMRLREVHGHVLVWDAHSIANEVPRLFEGRLPDLNFGTNDGTACMLDLINPVVRIADHQSTFSHVLNGRFKGGYITRRYGSPSHGVSAIQLELSQSTYMQPYPTFEYQETLASKIQPLLRTFFETLLGQWPQIR